MRDILRILFHEFYILNIVVCQCNRFTGHMAFSEYCPYDDAKCRKREDHAAKRISKFLQLMKVVTKI